jgi:hypothetical protein
MLKPSSVFQIILKEPIFNALKSLGNKVFLITSEKLREAMAA